MRKLLLACGALAALNIASSALAADMAVKAPVYKARPPLSAFNWTGCYVGGNVGGLWARKEWANADPRAFTNTPVGAPYGSHDADSWLGGVQVGCNYQAPGTGWVFGIQGDYDWTDADGSNNNLQFPTTTLDHTRIKSLASVTGRVGYAWDRFLGYVKGGGAWERDNYEFIAIPTNTVAATAGETRSGWNVGIGGEYAFTDWLSGFAEYDYYNFGTRTLTFVVLTGGTALTDVKETKNVLKVGLNVRFGYSPAFARY